MQLYTNVYHIQNGKAFNQTTNPGWTVRLALDKHNNRHSAKALQSIILYNATPVTLNVARAYFIQSPQRYKLTFVGETLGAGNFDPVSVQSSSVGAIAYQNIGTQAVTTLVCDKRNRASAGVDSNKLNTKCIQLCRPDRQQRSL